MITRDTIYNVKNRSASMVVYRIPEANVRREWQPGEVKRVKFGELEDLSYQPGGIELMANFLQILNEEAVEDLGIHAEPEYNMNESQIADLILTGSLDQFLDALDFAPVGVIDLIKKFSVSLPITDMSKRKALKDKTGFDVDKAIANAAVENEEESSKDEFPHRRRVDPNATPTTPGRRTSGEKYKVVSRN